MDAGFNSAGLFNNSENQNSLARAAFDFYVDGAFGNDSNNGSFQNPFRTIQRAVDAARFSQGNSVFVNGGVYNENVDIDENDFLRIVGDQHDPVVVDGNGNNVFDIFGGTEVEMSFMRVTDGADGINASNLGRLTLDNMHVDNNAEDGLFFDFGGRVDLKHSSFVGNGDEGADLEDLNRVYVKHSEFNNNGGNGIEARDVFRMDFKFSEAMYNGDDGLDAETLNVLGVEHSNLNRNFDDGADIVGIQHVSFQHTNLNFNDENGIEASDNGSLVFFGGGANDNGQNPDGGIEFFEGNGIAADSGNYIRVEAAHFLNNYNDGLLLENVNRVDLYAVIAKFNGDDGADAFGFNSVAVRDGIFSENYDDGLDFQGINDTNGVEVLADNANGFGNGNNFPFVSVAGGLYWDNLDQGMEMEFLQEAYVGGVSVLRNGFDGIDIDYTDYITVANSVSSFNGDDGGSFDDNHEIRVYNFVAEHNEEDGVDVDGAWKVYITNSTLLNNYEDGADLDGVNAPINGLWFFWNNASFNGYDGLSVDWADYSWVRGNTTSHNGYNGLYFNDNDIVWVRDVISQFNGDNGMLVYGFSFGNDIERTTNGYTDVFMHGGNYSHNGIDGIFMGDVGFVRLQYTQGFANHDDGLEIVGAWNVDNQNTVFAANGDQDVRIILT